MKSKYFYTVFLFILSYTFSTSAGAQDQIHAASQAPAESIVKLKVSGLTCGGDIKDIQKQVNELKGVTSCLPAKKPSATTKFEVRYNPAIVSEKEIRKAVESTAGCSDPESRPYKVKS